MTLTEHGYLMIADEELCQTLNLLRTSPAFVLREFGERGEVEVLKPPSVPANDGFYWVAGTTGLPCDRHLESVFRVDTNAGGELASVYWWIKGNWYDHSDPDALVALGLSKSQVFPFDYSYTVKLEEDIFHRGE